MIPTEDKFRAGQLKLLADFPFLKTAAHALLLKIHRNPDVKSMTLPDGSLDIYANFFLNCASLRNGKPVLDLTRLRQTLGPAFPVWLSLLRQTSGFTLPDHSRPGEDLYHRLCFAIPSVNWQEFHSELIRRDAPDFAQLQDAWKTAEYLMEGPEPAAPAEIGAKLFLDSKRLKNTSILTWCCRFLRQVSGSELPDPLLLEHFGMTANPTASTVTVFGPLRYQSGGRTLNWIQTLYEMGQSATLSWDNLRSVDRVESLLPVLTIENESVFNRIIRLNPVFTVVYTAGFPGKSVRRLIQSLSPDTPLFHWGDSDPEGYEIAAVLHRIHPLKLYRCGRADLEQLKPVCRKLPENKRRRAERLLEKPDFPFRLEIEWIIRNGLWLEQENYYQVAPASSVLLFSPSGQQQDLRGNNVLPFKETKTN